MRLRCAVLLMLMIAIGGCATSEPEFAVSPSGELRQRMDTIVLRVFSETKPNWNAAETATVGAGESAAYGAKTGASGGAKFGGGTGGVIARVGCDGMWEGFWFITCPGSIVAGAGVTIASAIVGGVGGAIYGASQGRTQEEIDAAVVALDRTILETKPADEFRARLAALIHQNTSTKIIEDERQEVSPEQRIHEVKAPIILVLEIHHFILTQIGRLSPDLWLDFEASANLYDVPEVGSRYEAIWNMNSKLGDFFVLTDENALGLRRKFDAAFDTMAAAVVDEIFLTEGFKLVRTSKNVEGKVVMTSGRVPASRFYWYQAKKKQAACGDADAQLELGRVYATIEPRVYGWRAQKGLVDAYKWLRLAELGGNANATSQLSELKEKLSADEIAAGERLVSTWETRRCGEEVNEAAFEPDLNAGEVLKDRNTKNKIIAYYNANNFQEVTRTRGERVSASMTYIDRIKPLNISGNNMRVQVEYRWRTDEPTYWGGKGSDVGVATIGKVGSTYEVLDFE